MTTIAGPQSSRMQTDDWITPEYILAALGEFDLDPCASATQPWPTATRQICPPADGLAQAWEGRVWLNPPYSREAVKWIRRLSSHGDGIALLFARTDTAWFRDYVWLRATAVKFLDGRVFFHHPDGTIAKDNGGAPSVLVAYGEENRRCLLRSRLQGTFVEGWVR